MAAVSKVKTALERIPPHSLEAEISVLGAVLLDGTAITRVVDIIPPAAFYRNSHRIVFETMLGLFEKNEPIDLVTVTEELKNGACLEEVGGSVYLSSLLDSVPTAANVEEYARIIKEKSLLRSVIETCTRSVQLAYEAREDPEAILDKVEQSIFQIAEERIAEPVIAIQDLITPVMERISMLRQEKRSVTGVASGFRQLDEMLAGFQPSDFIVFAARPSMGKTSFVLNVAEHAALQEKVPVAIFSMEMAREQVVQRFICANARVDLKKMRTGFTVDAEWKSLTESAGRFFEASIYIDDTPSLDPLELRAKARRLRAREKLGLIIVDYLQLMQCRGRIESRQQEISTISRSLKALARELKVPVIACSQLNREVESRHPPRPQLSDLRESGAIEQDADVVMLLWRESFYKPTEDETDIGEVIVAKQRNGPTGSARLAYIKGYTRFEDLEFSRQDNEVPI